MTSLPAGLSADNTPPLIRAIAAHALESSAHRASIGQPLSPEAWSDLTQLVARQRLWSLLAHAIADGEFEATDEQWEQSSKHDEEAVLACLHLDRELLRVDDLLRASGLTSRVFKGVAYAALFYPELGMRTYSDIDMFAPDDQFDEIATLLTAHEGERHNPDPRVGYTARYGKSAGFSLPGGWEVDLHRSPQGGPFGAAVRTRDLFTDPQTFWLLPDRPISAPSSSVLFLCACYHAILPADDRRLLPLRDVAQIMVSGTLDEREVRALADRWRGSLVAAAAVTAAHDFFALPDDAPLYRWATRYQSDAREDRWLRMYHDNRPRTRLWLGLETARAFGTPRDAAGFLYGQAFHEDRAPISQRARNLVTRLRPERSP